MDMTFRAVDPVQPAAGYIGGKKNLARRLIERIEATPHTGYAEAFVGMAGVFLRRRQAPAVEVINDLNGDVAGFFRVLQRHYVPFLDTLRWQLASRLEFERQFRSDPTTLTDIERAARFFYLQKLAFGGKVTGQNFGVASGQGARFNTRKIQPMLEAIHERLAGVTIEALDWRVFIDRYDRPGMLFYLDPPYYGSEHFYGRGAFERSDFAAMAERLASLKGTFILSINDHPAVREIFAGFRIEAATTTYSIANADPSRAGELIITPLGGEGF